MRVKRGGEHQGVLIDPPVIDIQREPGLFADERTREAQPRELRTKRRPGGRGEQRVARVEQAIVELIEGLAVKRFAAGLGKHVHVGKARPVVLRRVRVGIDADFANRRFGRQVGPTESIHENLAAVGTGSRTGERLQLQGKLVRVIQKRGDFTPPERERAGVGLRIGGDAARGAIHGDHFAPGLDGKLHVHYRRLR